MTAKPYRIEWRPMARDDLRAIVRYIGKDNPARARRFGQEVQEQDQAACTASRARPPRASGLA